MTLNAIQYQKQKKQSPQTGKEFCGHESIGKGWLSTKGR